MNADKREPSVTMTRDVTTDECPWLDADIPAGTILYKYWGYTYGCVSPAGIALTREQSEPPFFEVPRDAIAEVSP